MLKRLKQIEFSFIKRFKRKKKNPLVVFNGMQEKRFCKRKALSIGLSQFVDNKMQESWSTFTPQTCNYLSDTFGLDHT